MSWQQPKRVKVTVVDDEKRPPTIDLKEEIHKTEGRATKQAPAAAERDWREKYLRLAADLDNTRKRLAQTYQRQAEQEKEQLLADFLEVADNLERALAHADAENPDAVGLQAIQRQFQQVLLRHDVRPFDAEGQLFDPERHEAVAMHDQTNVPPNTVVHVAQKGYTIGDHVLRPARVVVSGS